jgi:hypothetical protein
MDDLSAPRSVVPNRTETIGAAIALVDGVPRWVEGEIARTSLAYALALLQARELSFEADDPSAADGGWGPARKAAEVAYAAWRDLGDQPDDPCYVDDGGSAVGG